MAARGEFEVKAIEEVWVGYRGRRIERKLEALEFIIF